MMIKDRGVNRVGAIAPTDFWGGGNDLPSKRGIWGKLFWYHVSEEKVNICAQVLNYEWRPCKTIKKTVI